MTGFQLHASGGKPEHQQPTNYKLRVPGFKQHANTKGQKHAKHTNEGKVKHQQMSTDCISRELINQCANACAQKPKQYSSRGKTD